MKNNLLGIAAILGFSTFVTMVTVTVASVQFQGDFATPDEEQNQELYSAYIENAFHVKPRDLMQKPDEAKKEHDEKMQGLFKSAQIDRDAENKEKYNKQLKKVAPQAKFKPMPKDPSIKQENTFKAIASNQQAVRIALWENDKKYLVELNRPKWWQSIFTAYATKQSKTPASNGYQSRCEKRGDQETTASEKNSPCRVAEASTNEVAAYNAYLTARLNHGPALEQDFCADYPESCSPSASTGRLIPTAYAALEMGGASQVEVLGYQETERRPNYEKEMKQATEAVAEANRQYLESDLAQNDHLRNEITIKGEEAENERLKMAGGNNNQERCQGTCKFPEKFHDSASGQGGTQQHLDA